MAIVVAAANWAVQYPINQWFTWGHFVFPVAFLVTDTVNRIFGPRTARLVVAGGLVAAVVASALLAPPRIVIASGFAFLVGQLADVAIFDRLRAGVWWRAPAVSSVVASVIDTAAFYGVAFAGTGLPWIQWGAADFGVKVFMVLPLLGPFRLLVDWLLRETWSRKGS